LYTNYQASTRPAFVVAGNGVSRSSDKDSLNLIPRAPTKSLKKRKKKRSQDEHFGAFQQEMYRKHSDRLLRTVLVTAISLSLLVDFPSAISQRPIRFKLNSTQLILKCSELHD
jgi:hypothetical protein